MPPSSRSSLALVIPGFVPAFAKARVPLPSLERLIANSADGPMATASDPTLEPWQCEVERAIGLDAKATYASAALSWLGAGGELRAGTWLHADAARFEVSNDGMSMVPCNAWPAERLAAVEQLFSKHLVAGEFSWLTQAGRAFIHSSKILDLQTMNPRFAATRSAREALPDGADAATLRRLMTELQMLLHEKFGDTPGPNAVWLWGNGAVPNASSRVFPLLWTNDDFSRGIYLAHDAANCFELPDSLDAVYRRPGDERRVCVIRDLSFEELERNWFAPALKSLRGGRFTAIELCLDSCHITVRRSLLKRLFGRRRSLHDVIAVGLQ